MQQAKKELSGAYVPGYGYDPDETYYITFKDGRYVDTTELERKVNVRNIIAITFYGSDSQFTTEPETLEREYTHWE